MCAVGCCCCFCGVVVDDTVWEILVANNDRDLIVMDMYRYMLLILFVLKMVIIIKRIMSRAWCVDNIYILANGM